MSLPLVTCLCLTTPGRREFLKRAYECFVSQTYENRTLLIVGDGDDKAIDTLLEDTRGFCKGAGVVCSPSPVIGAKRNFGCGWVDEGLIAVWDDDDFSAPGRLENQVRELEITRKAVTGYSAMKFTDGSAWWSFCCGAGLAIGASLMFRREWWETHRYPEVQVGEEAVFCEAARGANQLAEVPDLNLMYATIHPGNTSKRRPDRDAGWRALPGF